MKSPITLEAYGRGEGDLVVLDPDHPGFGDPIIVGSNDIAAIALAYQTGQEVPHAPYEAEHDVWAQIWNALTPRHEAYVVAEIQDADPPGKSYANSAAFRRIRFCTMPQGFNSNLSLDWLLPEPL